MKAVIDSDILIDYLQGDERSKVELAQYDDLRYSVISWMEIMAGAHTPDETGAAESLLRTMKQIDLNMNIARKAVHLRKTLKLKLPDAVILATADEEGCILVTRNTKDFRDADPRVRVPYRY